jgi:hypothetical protein
MEMPVLIDKKAPPTSLGGLKSVGRDAAGYATGGVTLLLGLGVAAIALPFLAQVPIVGSVINAGLGFARSFGGGSGATPSAKASMAGDGFGGL